MVGEGKDASNEGRVGGPAGQVAESLFPVRFLGFGFYWAWLFLAGVTPSPLIGAPLCFAGAPFEMVELSVRALVLVVVLIASRQLASVAGQRGLLVLGVAASAAAARNWRKGRSTPGWAWSEGCPCWGRRALCAR